VLRVDGGVRAVAWSADGRRVFTASGDRTVRVWDRDTPQPLLELAGHAREVTTLAVSADGRRVVSGSGDSTARVWDPSPAGSDAARCPAWPRPDPVWHSHQVVLAEAESDWFAVAFHLRQFAAVRKEQGARLEAMAIAATADRILARHAGQSR
jgi:WD40 repeat protein